MTALIAAIIALSPVGTVDLTDIEPSVYPVCVEEDCSDQPGQVGMWLDRDTGNWYLSLGETSLAVVDDTVTR
ncbi:hypothetical protein PBI_STASIA_82 [Mycobacterium phage Stasia]|uniref:Uncharacterized protein n=1 Tax=Mycobacterium phage Stasia TaxID=1897548 RepID=A0A1D8EUM1_9CAUD|nr:hypothetical protein KIY68_gp11 [Mycobacterium phage Stasia]AOT24738.1 hypothetical protein PBI_STASIA_82 [Mycobacterium phage Stasia]